MLERHGISESHLSSPIACEDIITQVAIVQSCLRDNEDQPENQCSVKKFCTEHKAELDECMDGCTSDSSSYRADWHNKTNVLFEVIDRAAGFTSRTIRTPEFNDR